MDTRDRKKKNTQQERIGISSTLVLRQPPKQVETKCRSRQPKKSQM